MPAAQAKEQQTEAESSAALVVLTPMQVLAQAVDKGASVDVLEKLMSLNERWEKNQARKAFDNAIAAAKAEITPIKKNRTVDFTSAKGRTNYKHEDLAEIARTIDPILGRHGLSYRYRTSSRINEQVEVTCIISHRDGHSEENTLSAGRDETGNKNSIQAIGSAVTFLERYTLKAALGLAASNDDDGRTAGKPIKGIPVITAEQQEMLVALIKSCGVGLKKFCQHYGIEKLEQLPAHLHGEAVTACNDYAAKAKAAKAEKDAKK